MQTLRQQFGYRFLALVALALQIGLAFGHHHDDDRHGRVLSGWAHTSSLITTDELADTSTEENDCPFCLTLSIASSTALIKLPEGSLSIFQVDRVRQQLKTSLAPFVAPSAFQARAPPSSALA